MRQILQRAAIFALMIAAAAPSQDSRPKKKVLFLTHSAGYVHDVVKRPAPDQLSFAEKELTEILRGFQVDCTQDCAVLTAENLKRYDVVAFYTTGELPAPPGGAEALMTWVRSGGRFLGIHCAADTWYTVPAYGDMIGGVFESHPWNQKVRVRVEDGHARWPFRDAAFDITDEIYQFKQLRREPLHVVLSLDLSSVDATKGTQPDRDYPLVWFREYGEGLVVYNALGHGEAVWRDHGFRDVLSGLLNALMTGERSTGMPLAEGSRDLTAWADRGLIHRDGSRPKWKEQDGGMVVVPKTGDIISKEKFGDFRLHLEFRVPQHPDTDKGQARGNSGVYLQDRYEIQILDSFGLEPKADDCGAIYGKKAPLTNACRKPGEWQSYDVGFKAARFDAAGKKIANARASAWQNGLKIHDDVEIDGPTGGGQPETPEPGPLRLQDHGNLVAFRNVWVVPR